MTLQQFATIANVYFEQENNNEAMPVVEAAYNLVCEAAKHLSDEDKETFSILCDARISDIL